MIDVVVVGPTVFVQVAPDQNYFSCTCSYCRLHAYGDASSILTERGQVPGIGGIYTTDVLAPFHEFDIGRRIDELSIFISKQKLAVSRE